MEGFAGEFTGTMLLLLMGSGVVANVVLQGTKGHNSGWLVITFGWAMAVFVCVIVSTRLGGSGHLNPAVTLALSLFHDFDDTLVLPYVIAQMAGGFVGSAVVWLMYKPHFDMTDDRDLKLAVFCTAPAIRNTTHNFFAELVATFVLVFGALAISKPSDTLGTLNALPVALLVLGIGLCLGGPTGYAINPARDLGPRLAHFILPIKNKRDSDWSYAWLPVVAPIAGACLAVLIYTTIL